MIAVKDGRTFLTVVDRSSGKPVLRSYDLELAAKAAASLHQQPPQP
jgi:hypothetical protein